ncbi:hypothetical protein FKM82_020046 [Ascaphus truei]
MLFHSIQDSSVLQILLCHKSIHYTNSKRLVTNVARGEEVRVVFRMVCLYLESIYSSVCHLQEALQLQKGAGHCIRNWVLLINVRSWLSVQQNATGLIMCD